MDKSHKASLRLKKRGVEEEEEQEDPEQEAEEEEEEEEEEQQELDEDLDEEDDADENMEDEYVDILRKMTKQENIQHTKATRISRYLDGGVRNRKCHELRM